MKTLFDALWFLDAYGPYQDLIDSKNKHLKRAGLFYKTHALVLHDRVLKGTQ